MAVTKRYPGGTELEISMLFVDVRGSTDLAERMTATDFAQLMNRFYETATDVLIRTDAVIDKLGGPSVSDNAEGFTELQGQYLAFIRAYTIVNGRAPAEADMQRFFGVTPPSVHQMVLTLEGRGLIARVAGAARSIRVIVPPELLPPLQERR